ncbi:MAG: protease HtpX [Chlamydiae bacterium]|nr:protease HtpX [Chlamydiota bacterium]
MFFKRIFLFIAVNFLVVLTISTILNLLQVRPYLAEYGIDYFSLLIFCLIWGMTGAFISLGLSRIMAKWLMGVKLVDRNTKDPAIKNLIETIEMLAKRSNLPVPQIGIYESHEVNAFATGPTRNRSLVAVSRGLLNQMSSQELEGVLAHEISHIANGDMVTMTLMQGVVNAFVMFLARVLAFVLSGLGKDRRQNSGGGSYLTYMVLVFVFEFIFMILGSLAIAWYSRKREYRADQGGATLAGKEKMVAALRSLQSLIEKRDPKAEQPAIQSFKIATPSKSSWMWLFASHPPLDLRIERLQNFNRG